MIFRCLKTLEKGDLFFEINLKYPNYESVNAAIGIRVDLWRMNHLNEKAIRKSIPSIKSI